MAWYADEHLRLLRTIRRLREDELLPLAAIRAALHDVASHPFCPRQQRMLRRMRQPVHPGAGPHAPAAAAPSLPRRSVWIARRFARPSRRG